MARLLSISYDELAMLDADADTDANMDMINESLMTWVRLNDRFRHAELYGRCYDR